MSHLTRTEVIEIGFESAVRALLDSGGYVAGAERRDGSASRPAMEARIGIHEVSRPVRVSYGAVEVLTEPIEVVTMSVAISGSDRARWYPVFEGELEVVAMPHRRVEVTLDGTYRAPLELTGVIPDAPGLHHVAVDAFDTYFRGVVERLRRRALDDEALIGHPE